MGRTMKLIRNNIGHNISFGLSDVEERTREFFYGTCAHVSQLVLFLAVE